MKKQLRVQTQVRVGGFLEDRLEYCRANTGGVNKCGCEWSARKYQGGVPSDENAKLYQACFLATTGKPTIYTKPELWD